MRRRPRRTARSSVPRGPRSTVTEPVAGSQIRTAPSSSAADHPPAVRGEARPGARAPAGSPRRPAPTVRSVPSSPPLTIVSRSRHERGRDDRAPVALELGERRAAPASNTRTTPSSPAVTSRRPSSLNRTEFTAARRRGCVPDVARPLGVPDAHDPVRRSRRDAPPVRTEVGADHERPGAGARSTRRSRDPRSARCHRRRR